MTKWWRVGLDLSGPKSTPQEADQILIWLDAETKAPWTVSLKSRIVGRMIHGEPDRRLICYVTLRDGRDATLFKMFHSHHHIVSTTRCESGDFKGHRILARKAAA